MDTLVIFGARLSMMLLFESLTVTPSASVALNAQVILSPGDAVALVKSNVEVLPVVVVADKVVNLVSLVQAKVGVNAPSSWSETLAVQASAVLL